MFILFLCLCLCLLLLRRQNHSITTSLNYYKLPKISRFMLKLSKIRNNCEWFVVNKCAEVFLVLLLILSPFAGKKKK